jgi:hypothetical protein
MLSGKEDKRIISKRVRDGKESTFKTPVTQKLRPKIYVLKYEGAIVYIGYASQSIGTRLGQGMRAAGLNGYHGYKWKQVDKLELYVFVFDQQLQGSKHKEDTPYINLAEAVEAELVYLVREKTGKWPEFQNEIHFNNTELENAKAIAADLYTKIMQ